MHIISDIDEIGMWDFAFLRIISHSVGFLVGFDSSERPSQLLEIIRYSRL